MTTLDLVLYFLACASLLGFLIFFLFWSSK
jgi:hypothetical protein